MIEFFDIYEYLNDRSLDYTESGTNTSRGWVNIQCPFPYCGDSSNHCGINLDSRSFNCWKCGTHGTIYTLIQELESCSRSQAVAIVDQFQDITDLDRRVEKETAVPKKSDFMYPPKGCMLNLPEPHLQYLRSRNFDPEIVVPKYQLRAGHTVGDYKFRIIIPIIKDEIIVNFTSRTIVKDAEPRYKMASIEREKPIINIYDLLYNFDNVGSRAFILEGPTDVWRFGDGSTSTFGTALSKPQIGALAGLDLAVLIFDAEAMENAKRLEYQIRPFVDTIVLELDAGLDPATLTDIEVSEIKKEYAI